MKTTATPTPIAKESQYPCLKIRARDNFIVLFRDTNTGALVHGDKP